MKENEALNVILGVVENVNKLLKLKSLDNIYLKIRDFMAKQNVIVNNYPFYIHQCIQQKNLCLQIKSWVLLNKMAIKLNIIELNAIK